MKDAEEHGGWMIMMTRAVGTMGGTIPPPQIFANQLTLVQPGGSDLAHHITTDPPRPSYGPDDHRLNSSCDPLPPFYYFPPSLPQHSTYSPLPPA